MNWTGSLPDLTFGSRSWLGTDRRLAIKSPPTTFMRGTITYPLCSEPRPPKSGAWLDHKAAQERLGYEAASEEVERLCNVMCDRERDLLIMPAPDHGALLWKLERLFGAEVRREDEFCDSWCPEWISAVMHDAGRLLSDGEAARISPTRALAA